MDIAKIEKIFQYACMAITTISSATIAVVAVSEHVSKSRADAEPKGDLATA